MFIMSKKLTVQKTVCVHRVKDKTFEELFQRLMKLVTIFLKSFKSCNIV